MTRKARRSSAIAKVPPATSSRPQLEGVTLGKGRATVISATAEQIDVLPQALGSDSRPFQDYLLGQTMGAMGPMNEGDDLTARTNAGLAILAASAPANELEALLVTQMIAAHHMAMLSWHRAVSQNDAAVVQANASLANKASRTFTLQMEALAKIRRGGEQIVRHIHVSEGGQAVIAGTFNHGGGRENE